MGWLLREHPRPSSLPAGWFATNKQLTNCSDVADTSNPVGQEFQTDLQNFERHLQKYGLNHVSIWPIFSYGVMYSFNTGR